MSLQEERIREMLNLYHGTIDDTEIQKKRKLFDSIMDEHGLQVHPRRPRCKRRMIHSRHRCTRCNGQDFSPKSDLYPVIFDHVGWAVPEDCDHLAWPRYWVLLSFPYVPNNPTCTSRSLIQSNIVNIPAIREFLNNYNRSVHVAQQTPYVSDETRFLLFWPNSVEVECECDVIYDDRYRTRGGIMAGFTGRG